MISPDTVSVTEDGVRLQRWFGRHYPNLNVPEFRKLCRTGQIRINAGRCRGNEILHSGDVIRIPPLALNKQKSQDNKIKSGAGDNFSLTDLEMLRTCIIHNDQDIVVFNKPAGLAVQGGTGIKKSVDKMAAALFPYDNMLLVHRLDRETSGVLIVAKNHNAAQKLSEEFQSKSATKEYLALLDGSVSPDSGIIDTFMIRGDVLTAEEASVYPDISDMRPRRAITKYKVLGQFDNVLTWIKFFPQTGRTHQLRLHAAKYLGTPIIGDDLYGKKSAGDAEKKDYDNGLGILLASKRLFLFAARISFHHPRTGEIITISAEMPDFMKSVVKLLDFQE